MRPFIIIMMMKDISKVQLCITHVDDFTIAGTVSFIEEVLDMIERELTISKIDRDKFRFTGLDVSTK